MTKRTNWKTLEVECLVTGVELSQKRHSTNFRLTVTTNKVGLFASLIPFSFSTGTGTGRIQMNSYFISSGE